MSDRERASRKPRMSGAAHMAEEPHARGERHAGGGRRADGDADADAQERARAERPVSAQPGLSRTEQARAALAPLQPGERPRALLIAMGLCALLAVAVIVGSVSVHDLSRHGGSLPGAALLASVFAALALGMARRRYWAVLGFEALLMLQILFSSLALIVASTLPAAGECLAGIGLGGWLFWKLVRVMGRIQAGERAEREQRAPVSR